MAKEVDLLFLDEFDAATVDPVTQRVATALHVNVKVVGQAKREAGFDPQRRQWRADILLHACIHSRPATSDYTVALTGRDLYSPGLNFVFGLARSDLGAAIVSWHRLDTGPSLIDRLAKEIVHEVGHLEGLPHCRKPSCVMWFSNTLAETDRKSLHFCPTCQRQHSTPA